MFLSYLRKIPFTYFTYENCKLLIILMICLTRMLFIHEMPQLLEILMTRTSMTPRNMERIWREVEEKFRMKPVLITWIIQFMFLTYHSYNHLLYLQIMDHTCMYYRQTLKLLLIWKSFCIYPQVMTWISRSTG